MRLIYALPAFALLAISAIAQTVSFEVASVKPQPWKDRGSVGVFIHGNTLDAEHCSLRDLIEYAYNLRDVQLSGGPKWTDRRNLTLGAAELYQVMAKAPGDTPPSIETFRQMLQALLADRFQLKVSHQQKDMPVYNLVVDKGGPKMQPSAPDTKFDNRQSSPHLFDVRMVTTQLTMDQFVSMVEGYAGRPIFNKTGLSGGFDFTLDFIPENVTPNADLRLDALPFLSAVRETLGLRLESAVAPFDAIFIESAERPTEN